MLKTLSLYSLITGLCFCLLSCTTSPTGRKQFLLVNDSQLVPVAAKSFALLKQQETVNIDEKTNSYVQCVVQPLIDEAKQQYQFLPARWEIVVFDNKAVNAFAMPGGKVGVFTGLIDLTENADQLAAVLGHEIAHVVSRHSAERMSLAKMTTVGLTLSGLALSENRNQAAIVAALGLGSYIGVQLPFSRTHETEADTLGQQLMAKAGFDPAQSVRLWELMGANGGKRPLELLSTHPDPRNRAYKLSSDLPAMQGIYARAQASGKNPDC